MSAPSRREPNEPQRRTEPSEEAVMPAPRSEAPDEGREALERIAALNALATPGTWNGSSPKRIVFQGQEGPLMSYLFGNGSTPEGMRVSLGSERVADHEFVAALVNAYRAGLLSATPATSANGASVSSGNTSGSEHSARAVAEWEAAFRDLFSNCERSDDTDEAIERARKFLLDHRATLPAAPK